jgi:putative cardiolipin synthase
MLLNTEIGVVTESELLARRLGRLIERDMAPANAWRVTMNEEGWLRWSAEEQELRRQPAQGFGQRLIEFMLNLLPLKNQV